MNTQLTKRVLELHAKGFHLDYEIIENRGCSCLQNNFLYSMTAVTINLVGKGHDQLTRTFKYIYTVETLTGEKGLLLLDFIYNNSE